jgi:hypothetical protein
MARGSPALEDVQRVGEEYRRVTLAGEGFLQILPRVGV